jgi:hypothetical protein
MRFATRCSLQRMSFMITFCFFDVTHLSVVFQPIVYCPLDIE